MPTRSSPVMSASRVIPTLRKYGVIFFKVGLAVSTRCRPLPSAFRAEFSSGQDETTVSALIVTVNARDIANYSCKIYERLEVEPARIHFVATHFSPALTGREPCKEFTSRDPSS